MNEHLEAAMNQFRQGRRSPPDADAPIYIGVKSAKAWQARVPMARAAIEAMLARRRGRKAWIAGRARTHGTP